MATKLRRTRAKASSDKAATNAKNKIAVVIGFRDWGLDRLSAAVRGHVNSTAGSYTDIVVSDYGSEDEEGVRKVVEAAGGRVVRTPRSGPWSRSRALNAGVKGTTTPYVITTDADMIFSKGCVENLVEMLDGDRKTAHLIQCRDLEEDFGADVVGSLDDEGLEQNSFFRPRWGMGGLVAFHRSAWEAIRGYDDRMEVYGGEDIDFADRLRRGGTRLNWVDDKATRIYHIWHPPTLTEVRNDADQLAAQQRNRDIMLNDKSIVRNLTAPALGGRAKPIASVTIASYNRADYLKDSINSALAQSVQDIEVVVVDDGSEDHTQDILSDFKDKRVRHYRQENSGVATARNRLVAEARSDFIVVHDDDDIMLPDRVKHHFEALRDDVVGTYGGWIDFDNETGEMTPNQGRKLIPEGFIYGARVLVHGASMFRKSVLQNFPYNESLRAGVDYHLISRMVIAGNMMNHTRNIHIMRRFHDTNLTIVNQNTQSHASRIMTNILRKGYGSQQEAGFRKTGRDAPTIGCIGLENMEDNFGIFLPDNLAERSGYVAALSPNERRTIRRMGLKMTRDQNLVSLQGKESQSIEIQDLSFDDMPKLRALLGDRLTYRRPSGSGLSFEGDDRVGAFGNYLSTSSYLDPEATSLVLIKTTNDGDDSDSDSAAELSDENIQDPLFEDAAELLECTANGDTVVLAIFSEDVPSALRRLAAARSAQPNIEGFLIKPNVRD